MSYTPSKELRALVDQSLDASISQQQLARLEDILRDEMAMQYYLDMVGLHTALDTIANDPRGHGVVNSYQPESVGAKVVRFTRRMRVPAAAAAVFVCGAVAGKFISSPSAIDPVMAGTSSEEISQTQPSPIDVSASITSMVGVEWSDGVLPKTIQLLAESEPIAWDAGLMEITFASGVRALIEGPAEIQVTGNNDAYLTNGRLVADVPKGAEGFTVSHGQGRVVDLGTEFAINVPSDLSMVEVGVFSGEVEVYNKDQNQPVKVFENHAIVHGSSSDMPFESVPFYRENYIRNLPSREFPWTLPAVPATEHTKFTFDVSHLVWRSGDYRAVVKWMTGNDSITVTGARLLLDGMVIATDNHIGVSGLVEETTDNTFEFYVPEEMHSKGRWTLEIQAIATDRSNSYPAGTFSPDSSGILLFEEGHALSATEKDFLGTWDYRHDNDTHQRIFLPNNQAIYIHNGRVTSIFSEATWSVSDGILTLVIPPSSDPNSMPYQITERHILRNSDELIFIDQPYRNAEKSR